MKLIKLNNEEFSYITSAGFLPNEVHNLITHSNKKNSANYILKISEENADILRDLFGEQLQLVGFDENYKLTKEGQILEDLVDKFFF